MRKLGFLGGDFLGIFKALKMLKKGLRKPGPKISDF